MVQIISKNGKVLCTTTVPYSKEIIKQMKKSGYKVVEKEQSKNSKTLDNSGKEVI